MHIYAVDTQAFYTDREHEVEQSIIKLRQDRYKAKEELEIIQQFHAGKLTDEKARSKLEKLHGQPIFYLPDKEEIPELCENITELGRKINKQKSIIKSTFGEPHGTRTLRPEYLTDKSVISIFESYLTRTLKIQTNTLSDALVIVRVYFFEVFEDLVRDGFYIGEDHYVVLTASAGQIRTKKCVFIKESLLKQYSNTIMCGLTVDKINELGGCNTNKYLAYLALTNSATDEWPEFNIRKTIVVDDMETLVRGTVDYIDDKTYEITRQEMDVPINHTDGCGMVLPRLTGGKNMMVRLPWVKGLLASFDFERFVFEANADGFNHGIVTDIYGKQHDIISEKIEVIFTKSQTKLWKYYNSWEEYQNAFEAYNCAAGVCNVEEDIIENATINYQMLQTLTDITDDELNQLVSQTRFNLEHLSTDRRIMLKALGATKGNPHKTPAQEALMLYPELLQDPFYREQLRMLKASMEKDAWSGKLDIWCKYLFIIPDLYAFCQWLFLGDKNPRGLLEDGEVYAAQFRRCEKLDCLRSPHLYREHAVRKNLATEHTACEKWFGTNGIYTSCHDLICKILVNDFDGDKSLVCGEPVLVEVAERNMDNIVPLFYTMAKAAARTINTDNIYSGMITAYVGGNIGAISNDITKMWNQNIQDCERITPIQYLCMENNFTIDHAKTLYKPHRPRAINKLLRDFVNCKTPHFFIYAKDKLPSQVEPINNSTVNRLLEIIPKYRFKYNKPNGGKFDYHMLMDNPLLIRTPHVESIIEKYSELARSLRFNSFGEMDDTDTRSYLIADFRESMFSLGVKPQYVVDAIIQGIFGNRSATAKLIFWCAFGDIVLDNLKRNLLKQSDSMILCERCYTRYEVKDGSEQCPYCVNCV